MNNQIQTGTASVEQPLNTLVRKAWAVGDILATLRAALPEYHSDCGVPTRCFLSHVFELAESVAHQLSDVEQSLADINVGGFLTSGRVEIPEKDVGKQAGIQAPAKVVLALGLLKDKAQLVYDILVTLHAALPDDRIDCNVPAWGLMSHVVDLAGSVARGLDAIEAAGYLMSGAQHG